ncbi:MAG TPA: PfkB family carbohydrate kinase [Candidatus Hydrogenedentes bacterium]|nr:PfkB family carbohydrate kinase [Candidatus Hydrogenedentota bacterium]
MESPDIENQPIRIVGAGICCLDHIVVAPTVPWGNTAPVREYCMQGGGLVATALVACARLGAQTELLSMLGDDAAADHILAELGAEHVSTAHVLRQPGGASPFSFIHVDEETGERTIFHRRATGMEWRTMDRGLLAGARAVLVDGYYPELARDAVRAARACGVPTVADTVPGEANAEWLRDVSVLIAPRHYLRAGGFGNDLERALDAIHAMGPATAVVTLGADGWVASAPEGRSKGNAFQVGVVDTVGAGDVFHGAYAYGLARDWPTARCAEFAAAVAAVKCTRVGGRAGIPTLGQALEFLRARSANGWTGIA